MKKGRKITIEQLEKPDLVALLKPFANFLSEKHLATIVARRKGRRAQRLAEMAADLGEKADRLPQSKRAVRATMWKRAYKMHLQTNRLFAETEEVRMDTQREIDALHDAITDCFIAVQGLRVPVEAMEEKAAAASRVLDVRLRVERLGMRHSNVFINPTELTRRAG